MQIFTVAVNRDDSLRVIARDVVKETPQFYVIEYGDGADRYAFGFGTRFPKQRFETSARGALKRYMERRQRDKENARAVVAQCTKQIASANELLMMQLPDDGSESPQDVPAVEQDVEVGQG